MKVPGIVAVAVTLLSGTAFAGDVFHFDLGHGKTARIQFRDCGDRFCAPRVLLRQGPSRSKKRSSEPRDSASGAEWSASAPSIATSAPIATPPSTTRIPAPAPSSSIPAPAMSNPTISALAAPSVQSSPKVVMRAASTEDNLFEALASKSTPAAASAAENPFAAPAATLPSPAPAAPIAAAQSSSPEPRAQAQPAPPVRTAALPAAGPVGEWIVEDGIGRVRIDECGKVLCGVVSSAKDASDTDRKNPDLKMRKRPIIGTPVLLEMQATRENRWEGQVYNVRDGQTYTAKMSMRNPDTLRIEGCVMRGMFCGGQNWKRAQ